LFTAAESLLETVRQTLRLHPLLQPNDTVLAAVSGGPDSVCLLDVLLQLGFAVEVAHLDHGTRRGASAADAEFVRGLCAERGLRFHFEARDVADEARDLGLTFEEHARNARYGFLLRTARLRGCTAVATGHHADDQAETLLMRIVRGTTPRGLAGIPVARKEGGLRIVRPLIDCTRAQILDYLWERGLPYRTDASNADEAYLRNRVRARLLPLLESDFNPRVRDALLRLGEAQRTENDFLDQQAAALLARCLRENGDIDRQAFAAAHRAVQRRAMLMITWRHGLDECPFDRVDGAVAFVISGPAGRSYDLGAGVLLRNSRTVTEVRAAMASTGTDTPIALAMPGETCAHARRFVVR
jgi:tRNA(Ile)-lysidine synthase